MRLTLAVSLWIVVGVLGASWLEERMLTHALVQLPLLALAGAILAPRSRKTPHPLAVPALLVGLFSAAIWMLPRMLDESLTHAHVEWAKRATLPLMVGLPLGWCFPQLSQLTRSIVWSNLVSMFLTLGWLYLETPVRVCNFYVASEQRTVGLCYLGIAAAIVAYWLPRVFLGEPERLAVEDGTNNVTRMEQRRPAVQPHLYQ